MSKTTVLIENPRDVRTAIEWGKRACGTVHFVGLYPDVAYKLEKENVDFSVMNDYFDVDFVNSFVSEESRKLETFCQYLDKQIQNDINPAYGCFSQIRILHDVIRTHSMIIRNIIQKTKPTAIRLYSSQPRRDPTDGGEAFCRHESVYALLLEAYNWGLIVRRITRRVQRRTPAVKSGLTSIIKQNNFLYNCGVVYKHNGVSALWGVISHRLTHHDGNTVLLYGGGYNWDDCTGELMQSGISNIIRIDDEKILTEYQNANCLKAEIYDYIFKLCMESEFVRGLPEPEDITEIFCYRSAKLIERSYNISMFTREYILSVHKKTPLKCLLLSSRSTEIAKTIVQTARKLHIPVISWQHGGTGYGYDPMMYHDELYGSDIHFVFGDCVADKYRELCKEHPDDLAPGIIPVGTASLDNLKIISGKSHNPKTVLYISSYYHKNDHSVIYLGKSSPNEALWFIHKVFLILAKNHPECNFIIKLNPLARSKEPLESCIADNQINNVKVIIGEKTLPRLLSESDIVFVDTISTGILQALTTEKEIFVYSGIYKIEKQTLDCLKKRAHVFEFPENAFMALSNYLTFPVRDKPKNTEFLKCYGTYKNDGLSAKRAVEIIQNRITNTNPRG